VIYGLAYEQVMPLLSGWRRAGNVTFSDLMHVEPWLVIVLFMELTLGTFYWIERGRLMGASGLGTHEPVATRPLE
jgi:hypothetical protein